MSRRKAQSLLGPDAILAVDPRRIDLGIGQSYRLYGRMLPVITRVGAMGRPGRFVTGLTGRVSYALEPFFLSPARLSQAAPVENDLYYQLVHDFVSHRAQPENSRWFAHLAQALHRTGKAQHKNIIMTSEAEIMAFLNTYVGGMCNSLERDGYIETGADMGTAVIGPGGRIFKAAAGSHRFAAMRVLALAPIPVRIMGADAAWARETGADRGGKALVEAVRAVAKRYRS